MREFCTKWQTERLVREYLRIDRQGRAYLLDLGLCLHV
jgi:hypothetical protein